MPPTFKPVIDRRGVLAGLGASLLAGCQTPVARGLPDVPPTTTPTVAETPALPPASGETLGTGPVRVALLLPLSAEGTAKRIGGEFRNAAALAMEDVGPTVFQLVVKDTGRDPATVQAAASQAVAEASSLVLGPIFSADVQAAATITRPSDKVMIAFSSDRTVAGSRVFLNSFLPDGVVRRVATHAAQNGTGRVVGFFTNGAAGDIAERAAREALGQNGGSLVLSVRYDLNEGSILQAASSAAGSLQGVQGILIPEGGAAPGAILTALRSNGGDLTGIRPLGTGQWTSSNLADPLLQGAWFADSDQQRLASFKSRYKQRFGADPSANAALAYDTVVMVGALVRQYGAAGLAGNALETGSGFAGYAGTFRFRADGTTERGYAVYEISPGGTTRIVSPAPQSFGPAA